MKALISYKLETSDHDGYCSGNECEYECKIDKIIVDVPYQYKSHPLGTIDDPEEYNWIQLLPEPELNDGSCYCELADDCVLHGLGIHDYKYTILSVVLVDSNYRVGEAIDDEPYMEKLDMKKIYQDDE